MEAATAGRSEKHPLLKFSEKSLTWLSFDLGVTPEL